MTDKSSVVCLSPSLTKSLSNPQYIRLTLLKQPNQIQNGMGECSQCSCPGYSGSGYTCERGGCGHHYDEHW